MPELSDGLALIRIAEEVAELGAASGLAEDSAVLVLDVVRDPESASMVAGQLEGNNEKATAFLARVADLTEIGEDLDEDDEPRFVMSVAALGSLIVRAATDQPTGVIEAVAAS